MFYMTKNKSFLISDAILNNTNIVYLIIDKKGIITFLNETVNHPDINPKDLINQSFYDFALKKDKKIVKECIQSIIKNPSLCSTFTFQSKYKQKVKTWKANAQNLFNDQNIKGILISICDVSENKIIQNLLQKQYSSLKKLNNDLKKTNTKLKEKIKCKNEIKIELDKNREQFQLLINKANESICVAQDGLLKFVNPKFCKMVNSDEKELLFKPFINFIHPEDRKKVIDRYKKRLAGKKVPDEYVFRTVDTKGKVHWVEIHAAKFKWNDKPATVNFLNEVTDKLITQQRFEKLFDSAPFLLSEIDVKNHSVLMVNPAFEKSIGVSEERITKMNKKDFVKIFLSDKTHQKRWKIAEKAIKENRIITFSDQRAGHYFYNSFVPFNTLNGDRHLFVIAQEVSDLIIAEQKYKRLINTTPDAIAEVDGKTKKILLVNQAMAKNFKISKESFIGKDWKFFLPPHLYKERYKMGLKAINEEKIQIFEDKRNNRYYQNFFIPFKTNEGSVNLQLISRDITDQVEIKNELKENKEFLDNIINTIADPIFVKDKNHKWILLNNAFCEFMDLNREELLGKSDYDFFPRKEADIFWEKDNKVFETGMEDINEEKITDNKGKVHTIITKKKPFSYKNGKKILVGIIHDISKHKKMEEQLQKSEEKYRNYIESAPDGVFICDEKGRYLEVNDAAAEITGYTKQELTHLSIKDLLTEKSTKEGLKHFNCLLENGRSTGILQYKRKDGSIGFWNVSSIKLTDTTFLGYTKDVTELINLQDKIRESEKKFRAIISSAHDGIIIDQHGKINLLNKSVERIFGYNHNEIIGKDVKNFLMIANYDIRRVFNKSKQDETTNIIGNTKEINAKRKNKEIFPVELSLSVIRFKGTLHAVIIIRDISERKKMEHKLRQAKQQLEEKVEQRTQSLKDTLKELQESEELYRSLIESAPVGIGIADEKGKILDMNTMAQDMSNFLLTYFNQSKKNYYQQHFEKLCGILKKKDSILNLEEEFIGKNGKINHSLINIKKISYRKKPAFLTIQQDITKLKETEKKLREMHGYLNNVINSASEFIFTLDENQCITMWNKTAENYTDKPASQIIGKRITDVSNIINPQVITDCLKNISLGYSTFETDLIVKTKNKGNLIFSITCSQIKDEKNNTSGYIIFGQNVTKAKQLYKNIIKGSSYLQYKNNLSKNDTFLIDLKSKNKSILLITRASSQLLTHKKTQMDLNIVYLGAHLNKNHVTSCEEVFSKISIYCHTHDSSLILIDRIDYLIMTNTFEKVLNLIYRLKSLIERTDSVLIIQINPDLFSKNQLSLLEEELEMFQGREVEDISLEEHLYKLLTFIYKQNQRNFAVSFGMVGSHFNISKVTTGKRISELEQKGLISISLKGRMKTIRTTIKGEKLISNR
jgi:PAS domain S-box-containing protein